MQTWATFSIIDHRFPIYRQALALFDRIVVPLPPEPIGDQTRDELTQLEAEVDYLQKHEAAVLYPWDSDAFQEWRRPFLAEGASASMNRDVFMDTRLMTAAKINSPDAQAVPVYGGQEQYEHARHNLMQVEQALTTEILQRLPVPDPNTPLSDLIELRNKPAFRTALDDLLEWKRAKVPMIVLDPDRGGAMKAAMREFDKLTIKYAEAMKAHGHKTMGTVASIFISAGLGDVLGAFKEGLVSFRELREPSWKKVSEMKCAPGGVIYHFKEAIRG